MGINTDYISDDELNGGQKLANKYDISRKSALMIFRQFLDDVFQVFTGTFKQLHKLYNEIYKIHSTHKITMVHTSV